MTRGRVSDLQTVVLGTPEATLPAPLFDTATDLAAELVARPLDYRACQRLASIDVPGRFVAELNARCLIGAARVQLSPRGDRWQLHGPDARLLIGLTEGEELVDILAVSTAHPDQIARRTGAGWCLGDDLIRKAEGDVWGREKRVTLKLVPTPLDWLRAAGRAVCVLDWAAGLPHLRGLSERATLECDAGAGARIRALLEIGGLPKVKERAPAVRAVMGEAA